MSTNTFTFTGKAKTTLLVMMLAGLALIALGMATFGGGGHGHDDGHGVTTHGQQEQVEHATQDLKNAAEEAHTTVVEEGKEKTGKVREKIQNRRDEAKNAADHAVETVEEHIDEHGHKVTTTHGEGHEVVEGKAHAHGEEDTEHSDGHDAAHTDGHGKAAHGDASHDSHNGDHGDAHDSHSVGHDAHAGGHGAHGDDHGGHAIAGATPITAKKVLWTNMWAVIQMMMWMAMAAMFFLAAHTAGWAGFHIIFQKVLLAIMSILPVAFLLGALVFIVGRHDIFIWTNSAAMDASELMQTKKAFLNTKSFAILSAVWCAITLFLLSRWWSVMNKQDAEPSMKHFSSSRKLAAVCIVLVAIINAFGVWHWIMSIEPNWYSTMYAWYTMASGAAIMIATTILTLMYLQSKGYLPNLNESHYHDLGKYLFAISVFWTYVWFSQYMLIWYGNIPEETVYFRERMANYPVMFYGALLINFFFAFIVLIKRDAKRNRGVMIMACILIIIGHWFDFFNMIVPFGVNKGGMGIISVGCLLLGSGIVGFTVLTALTRTKSLDSREHPYYQESLKHHI